MYATVRCGVNRRNRTLPLNFFIRYFPTRTKQWNDIHTALECLIGNVTFALRSGTTSNAFQLDSLLMACADKTLSGV